MDKSAQELWENCLEIIKKELSEKSFDLWIKPIKAVSVSDDKFLVEVPNKFFSDWIKLNLQDIIEKELSKQINKGIILEYSVMQNLDEIIRKTEQTIDPIQHPNDESIFSENQFNPKYTFEKFVVGSSNKFAQAAAMAVADAPGKAYNPLFIYGGVGLGKTHLFHAIGNKMKQINPSAKVLYITCEKFVNEFVFALSKGTMAQFHHKYRSLDTLLIDDIHFLGKGEHIQEVFHHTFNALYDAGKQIVISADSAPKEIITIQDRLRSRFEWGLVADILQPDLETRIAILRSKTIDERIHVPEDVILFIASHIKANIRELEGALIKIVAHSSLIGSQITVDRAQEILKDIVKQDINELPITIEKIQKVVAKHFKLDIKDLKSKKRTDAIAQPRQIAMYLARKLTESSTIEIGETFGGRDHTTVLYAYDKIEKALLKDPIFTSTVSKIIKDIKTIV
ncbi:MAG: chromosomal replication initiation protein DnaA [Elusimicrobia bacterium RIFOXYC2_FULL_34_12]|nr:MAG: chromosomal replication initiation protein DnaA [Elusimicrobia bacterium RIFOXYC2_FULL_34_12]OGS38833.1 MAG: chromosomal replication initiation protein DnaA [Elusimicrobia bacterium RIFOXYD2_FULL_34_30]HAM38661.1 chromosomal replication initiator protein DnaA [Elusimicrobiota bacterium]